ncbi:MAG: 5-(carboxyamino)imidazole ribonucleotide mutase [Spirochaetia bacterium]|nr:5-(carboxyamino)imidazole ribonucleotide mutase [Spirochaetia bacterium]
MISIVMGSISDWDTMKECAKILDKFKVKYEKKIVSAHRSPEFMFEYSKNARRLGIEVIIAGAGGAAHLPGMIASLTTLPVLGVPVHSKSLSGIDSLYSIVQMPAGVPVGTLAIGTSGAINAGLLAIRILSLNDKELQTKLEDYREEIKLSALSKTDDLV